ncbi:MAG: hypothetical protein PUP91_19860 [Rhizonema sp. PD37]|nr:hypothetical protein [Rhizonema sp. PD37]
MGKPNPEAFLLVANKMKILPSKCVT